MQFYQQSAIVDKGLKITEYAYERLDVIVGSVFAVLVAGFITIACAATCTKTHSHRTAQDAAMALRPLAGEYASTLFALGLLNASVFSAAILRFQRPMWCARHLAGSGVSHRWRRHRFSLASTRRSLC